MARKVRPLRCSSSAATMSSGSGLSIAEQRAVGPLGPAMVRPAGAWGHWDAAASAQQGRRKHDAAG